MPGDADQMPSHPADGTDLDQARQQDRPLALLPLLLLLPLLPLPLTGREEPVRAGGPATLEVSHLYPGQHQLCGEPEFRRQPLGLRSCTSGRLRTRPTLMRVRIWLFT